MVEVIREELETRTEEWLGPIRTARDEANRVNVVVDPRSGQVHVIERPDHAARARVALDTLKMVYGPAQRLEVTGEGGGPVELRLTFAPAVEQPQPIDVDAVVEVSQGGHELEQPPQTA